MLGAVELGVYLPHTLISPTFTTITRSAHTQALLDSNALRILLQLLYTHHPQVSNHPTVIMPGVRKSPSSHVHLQTSPDIPDPDPLAQRASRLTPKRTR